MAFNPSYGENLSQTMGMATSTKASGKRKKRSFKLKARKRGFTPDTFDRKPYLLTDYVKTLPENMPATTARNNNGMSFIW